jgi:hypothetical protein
MKYFSLAALSALGSSLRILSLLCLTVAGTPGYPATSFAPLLESAAGIRILESLPEGASLLRRIGGAERLSSLSSNDRWRLDQWLQHLENGGSAAERRVIQQVAEGTPGVMLPPTLRLRATKTLKELLSEPFEPFAPEVLGHPRLSRAKAEFLNAGSGATASPVLESLEQSSFVADPYTLRDLKNLTTEGADFLARRRLGRSAEEVGGGLRGREVRSSTGTRYRLEGDLFTDRMSPSGSNSSPTLIQVVVARGMETGKADGFFLLKFTGSPGQKGAEAHLELIKTDIARPDTRGLGSALYDELLATVKRLGYLTLKLNADWTGRVVWAKKGFEFDPEYLPYIDGKRVSQEEFFRSNFERFLSAEGLSISQVGVKTSRGVQSLESMRTLRQPADYLNLVRLDGSKVRADQYVDNFVIQEGAEAELGIAFLLRPYFPRRGQKVRAFQPDDGTFVSDSAAPSWNGVLHLSDIAQAAELPLAR